MALALLRFDDVAEQPTLDLDTGTSPYYRIHLGKEVRREHGFTLLDQVLWSSPVQRNPAAGRHLDTRTRHLLDPDLLTERGLLVQLESMRDPQGRGASWSPPVRVPVVLFTGEPYLLGASRPAARPQSMGGAVMSPPSGDVRRGPVHAAVSRLPVRTVPVRSARETYSRPASLEDLLSAVARVAGPVVLDLLRQGAGGGAPAPVAGGGAAAPAPTTGTDPTATAIAVLLQTVLGALSRSSSLSTTSSVDSNRLTAPPERATPFIAPALLALAGPVISAISGPLIQALPQLLNAANQHKLASRQEGHQHISDILAQVDRTRLLEQLLTARSAPAAAGPTTAGPADAEAGGGGGGVTGTGSAGAGPALSEADLVTLIGLLSSGATSAAPTGTPAPAPAAPPQAGTPSAGGAGTATAAPSSPLSMSARLVPTARALTAARPSRALLTMATGPEVTRLGRPTIAFVHGGPVTLRFRLEVPADGPAAPLTRAILHLVLREPNAEADLLVREERLTDVRPGEVRSVALTQPEVAALPRDTDLEVVAALRWPAGGQPRQATCVRTVALVGPQHLAGAGAVVGQARELLDLNRHRTFWNRLWSSPTSDDEGRGPLWALDVAMRYSVLVTQHDRNAVMETRLRSEQPEHASVRLTTRGHVKGGLEVALSELNALLPLWPDEQPLDSDALAALSSPAHLATQGGDVVHRVQLEGRRGQRGLVWAVPVLSLRQFTLATVRETDAFGQVLTTEAREVRFPVIEAVRVLGLASTDAEPEAGASGHRFEGYDVRTDELLALEPAVRDTGSTAGGV